MDKDSRHITDLPSKQVTVVLDADIAGGLTGLRIITDGTINLTLTDDDSAGAVFPVSAGDVVVASILQINSGGTLTVSDVIGLV